MNIERHLVSLLYAHDCVIVPGFGGFIGDHAQAEIDAKSHIAYPPSKKIAFNTELRNNDGLLASYIASAERIDYADASRHVKEFVAACHGHLQAEARLAMDGIGLFYLDNGRHLHFKPDRKQNFLSASFGLAPLQLNPLAKKPYLPVLQKVPRPAGARHAQKRSLVKDLLPIAAVLALMLMVPALLPRLSHVITSLSPMPVVHDTAPVPAPGGIIQPGIESSSWPGLTDDPAAREMADSLPETTTPGTTAPEITPVDEEVAVLNNIMPEPRSLNAEADFLSYAIVVGCFSVEENATRLFNQLVQQGYAAENKGHNKAGLTMISASSHATLSEAEAALATARREIIATAWILKVQR